MYRKDIQKCANFILRFCPIEAIEAVEAAEVNEAAEVLRPGKPLLKSSESSRHLNPALFLCFEKKVFLSRIMNYHIEFLHLFCLFHFILARFPWNFFKFLNFRRIRKHFSYLEKIRFQINSCFQDLQPRFLIIPLV